MQDSQDIYKKEEVPYLARKRKRPRHIQDMDAKPSTAASNLRPRIRSTEDTVYSNNEHHRPLRKKKRKGKQYTSLTNRILGIAIVSLIIIYSLFLARSAWHRLKGQSPVASASPAEPADTAKANEGEQQRLAFAEVDQMLRKNIKQWERVPKILQSVQRIGMNDRPEAAIETLEEALKKTPDVIELKLALAQLYLQQNHYGKAEMLYLEILDVLPENKKARHGLAMTLLLIENYAAAQAVAEWILDTEPWSKMVRQIAVSAYLNTDKVRSAIPHLRKMIAMDKQSLENYNNLGAAYAYVEQYDDAIDIFTELIVDKRATAATYYNLAICYAGKNDVKDCLNVLAEAARLYGAPVVFPWLENDDFNAVRNSSLFADFQEQFSASSPAGNDAIDQKFQIIDPLTGPGTSTDAEPKSLFPEFFEAQSR